MSDNKSTLQYVSFSNLYAEPTFTTKKGKNWIDFGEDNLLPRYVDSLLDKSPDHSAIINGTIQFAQGNGLLAPVENEKAATMFQNGEWNKSDPNNLNAIQAKLIRDIVVHGAALIKVTWRRDGEGIALLDHVDVDSMRIDSEDEGYWICSDWSNPRKNTPEFFPKFDQEVGGTQLLYVQMPNARSQQYGMPSYWSARQAIELQHELMTFNLNRTKNNFFASVLLSFDDIPTAEEQTTNHESIKKFFTGSKGENVGGAMMMYGGGVEVSKFESSVAPADFFMMQEVADQRIRSAHRVTGRGDLFGLGRGDGSTFSSADDLLNEFETYSKMVIRPIQNVVLNLFNMIGEINAINHIWEIDPFVLFDEDAVTAESAPQQMSADATQIELLMSIVSRINVSLTAESALPLLLATFPSMSPASIEAIVAGAKLQTPPKDVQ